MRLAQRFRPRHGIEPAGGRVDPHRRLAQASPARGRRGRAYGALVLATGAHPTVSNTRGADLPHVRKLRTLADSRAIVAAAKRARRAVVIGGELHRPRGRGSLRARGRDVDVVATEPIPLARVLGDHLGRLERLHEEHGVTFHLGDTPQRIDEDAVYSTTGRTSPADLAVFGVGVKPASRSPRPPG